MDQRLVISGIWQLPLDRHVENAFLKKVTGGWQFNGIATFQGGQPITLYSGNNSSQQGNGLDRPDINWTDPILESSATGRILSTAPPPTPRAAYPGAATGNFWFNPSSYNCIGPYNLDGPNPPGFPLYFRNLVPQCVTGTGNQQLRSVPHKEHSCHRNHISRVSRRIL